MELNPVRTEADYEAALKEIDRLMDAEADTPEGARLDVLTTLVEAYEVQHHPIGAPCRKRKRLIPLGQVRDAAR